MNLPNRPQLSLAKHGNLPRTLIALIGLSALPCVVAAQGVRLQYNSSEGDSASYRMVMDGKTQVFVNNQTQESNITTEMYVTQSIKGFKDGIVDLYTKIDSGQINVNGNISPIPYIGQQIRTGMKKNGEVVSNTGTVPIDINSMQFVFPDRELDIGDRWDSSTPPSAQVPVTLTVVYKIVGMEKIKGRDCVKIASRVRSDKDTQIRGLSLDVKADGNIYFAYNEGLMIKNSVDSRMTMVLKRVVNEKEEQIITKMNMKMGMEYLD